MSVVSVEVFPEKNKTPIVKQKDQTKFQPEKPRQVSSYQATLEKYLNELTILEDVYDDAAFDYFDSIQTNYVAQVLTKQGKVNDVKANARIYHPVIMMKKELRSYIRHDSKQPLCVIDAASMNPTFLGFFIKDEEERNRWLKLCFGGNFYTDLVNVDKSEKQVYKERFMVAVSNEPVVGKKVKLIRDTIQNSFPQLHKVIQKIHERGETVCGKLQILESKIFRNDEISNLDKFHLPMHDGLLVLKTDVQDFLKILDKNALDVLGYRLKFTFECFDCDEKPELQQLKEGKIKLLNFIKDVNFNINKASAKNEREEYFELCKRRGLALNRIEIINKELQKL